LDHCAGLAGKSINILLLLVRPESEMHMDLSLASTFGGGPLVRVKEPESASWAVAVLVVRKKGMTNEKIKSATSV